MTVPRARLVAPERVSAVVSKLKCSSKSIPKNTYIVNRR